MTTPNSEQPQAAEEASAQETTLRQLTTRPDTNYLRSDGGKLMDLFELGHTQFKALTQELAAYGLHVDPTLELRRSNGLLCYYNVKDGHIYLAVPGLETPSAILCTVALCATLDCSQDELQRFWPLFMPYLIAHELAHHLRHRAGLFGPSLWHEEQIANKLGMALTRHRCRPDERAFVLEILTRGMRALGAQVPSSRSALLSYDGVLDALHGFGTLGDDDHRSFAVLERLFACSPEELLGCSGRFADDLAQRDRLICAIDTQYTSDFLQYNYCQLGWAYLGLTRHSRPSVDAVARTYFNQETSLLPAPQPLPRPSAMQIQACYQAACTTRTHAPAASRYFYKRYRRLLLTALQALHSATGAPLLDKRTTVFLENWSEGEPDGLEYVAGLADAPLSDLAPSRIGAQPYPLPDVALHLPDEADRRLWAHVAGLQADPAARETLRRLMGLECSGVFRALSAEAMLDLSHLVSRVTFSPGETIVWKGDCDNDVYLIVRGQAEVLTPDGPDWVRVDTLGAGETIGEMAFLARAERSATVRATTTTECFVMTEAELRIIAYEYPSILTQIAAVLTRRLALRPTTPQERRLPAENSAHVSISAP